MLLPEEGEANIDGHENLLAAIKTILVADLVMSLDNVIAVAAAAGDSITLLILGPRDQHSAGDFRQHAAAEGDGALPDHHHRGRGAARLRRRRDDGHRPGDRFLGVEHNARWLEDMRVAALAGAVLVVIVGMWLAKQQQRAHAAQAEPPSS